MHIFSSSETYQTYQTETYQKYQTETYQTYQRILTFCQSTSACNPVCYNQIKMKLSLDSNRWGGFLVIDTVEGHDTSYDGGCDGGHDNGHGDIL